jgi:hypothetical protein
MKNIVTRESRITAVMRGPKGAGRDEKNLDYWSNRANKNSEIAPRASDGPMRLPSTTVRTRDSNMKPFISRNARAVAKDDLNHDPSGSPFIKSIRRQS